MNSETSTKQTRARPNKNTAESVENISAMKRNQNIYNDILAISFPVVSSKSLRLSTHLASNIRRRTGNNLRGITSVRGPIWGIHSLTLIISCLKVNF